MRLPSPTTAALCLLTGCGSFATPSPVVPPANLTAPCPDLPPPAEPMTLGDLLRFAVEAVGEHRECQARHQALGEWVTRK